MSFEPYDASRALAPVPVEFVHETASDSLSFERTRALNAARAACAADFTDTDADDAKRRAYERYVALASEACAVLETKPLAAGGDDASECLRWRSALEGAGAARDTYASPGLRGERAFALFGLAGCHRRACARAMREGDDVASAATSARIAAGVFAYLANEVLPPLRPTLETFRANELTVSMSEVMRLVSLGDAQGRAARRAREKNSGWNLVARLHVAARNFYRDADAVIQRSRCDWNGVDIALLASVVLGKSSHEAEAYLALAEAFRARDECGQAVAACARAGEALDNCAQASKERPAWDAYHREIVARHREMATKTRKENDVVFFQKVPPTVAPLPEPAVVATAIAYEPKEPSTHSFFVG